jgi:hypothetical protein
MSAHELRTWPEPFQAVLDGTKRHEVRRDDRDFKPGDEVGLHEYDPVTQCYTGRALRFRIGYLSRGPEWGMPKGLCVFTLTGGGQ